MHGNLTRVIIPLTVGIVFAGILAGNTVYGQAGLREALVKMDRNEDGRISPHEIPPRARPYLERIAQRRMSLYKTNDINRILDAARVYYAIKNGVSDRDIRPGGKPTVLPFGPLPGETMIPEFGLPVVKYRYSKNDLLEAAATMRRYDENRDGYIDVREASRHRWTHRDPFEMDFNKDRRLSLLELSQRYARRRMLDDTSNEVWRKARRTGGLMPNERRVRAEDEGDRRERIRREASRSGGGRQLAYSLLYRFDSNRNGRLEGKEIQSLGMPSAQIDTDADGDLSRDELQAYLTERLDPEESDNAGLPDWLIDRDANKDGQISMSEFAKEWSKEKLDEFNALDANGDGLLTAAEALVPKAATNTFFNHTAEVLRPGKSIVSEIEIDADLKIADLNLQLSITHTFTSHLDAFLTGPDGQRIELFTSVGGRDDHFAETVFDDQARTPITKTRPPFRGTFIPEGASRKQPGLSHFNGKSAKGLWQLVVRSTRSDRFGMLHSWGLIVQRPGERLEGEGKPKPDATTTDEKPEAAKSAEKDSP